MVDMTGNNFFDEDDEFFADAFRSISEIETSLKAVEEDKSVKQKDVVIPNDPSFLSTKQKLEEKSCSEISSSQKVNKCYDISLHIGESKFLEDGNDSSNQHFLPKYIPKTAKRKFPGPAGILIDEPPRKVSIGNSDISQNFEDSEIELELVKSSQFSVEELLETVSWKKLQEDVLFNHRFLSNAKHFNVQRILKDTSRKKLPKHIVVPILCLYIKKFNPEEPVSTYMDDTGEISGKIDKEVLELYSDYIKAGTSLVLKKITFVCNIMLLEKSSLVSIYLDDGTVHHIQNWDTLIKESTHSVSCIFPVTPKNLYKSGRRENLNATPILKPSRSTELISSSETFSPKNPSQNNINTNIYQNETEANNGQNVRNDAANFSHPDLEMDDFDELLGNLDEKSFLEDF